jgi:hypothetical protein
MGNAMLCVRIQETGTSYIYLFVAYLTTLSASQTILVQWLDNK